MSKFENISPIDHRYFDEELSEYLSEKAYINYKLKVELALIKVFVKRGFLKQDAIKQVKKAIKKITPEQVYEEELKTKHDLKALVNCLRNEVDEKTKPFIHLTATSYDISDTANALRYKQVTLNLIIPALLRLEKNLVDISLKEKNTTQIGRTHGQHAVPITFGFALASYVSRLGYSIEAIKTASNALIGKFSGAAGGYNASDLFFTDPEKFEEEVLSELGLSPADHSTQIVQPERLTRLLNEIMIASGILANLADDMRNLQRTEIEEVREKFDKDQVGSSTMPHKRNPITFEHIKSIWKIILGKILTVYADQISEHQRDLTNSASGRTYGEIFAYFYTMVKRTSQAMTKLEIDEAKLKQNISLTKGSFAAEPVYLFLSLAGEKDAHTKTRELFFANHTDKRGLADIVTKDDDLRNILGQKSLKRILEIIQNPETYTGISAKKAEKVAKKWRKRLKLN